MYWVPADKAWTEANPRTLPTKPDLMLDPKNDRKHGSVSVLCASMCGRLLAAGSQKGALVVWSLGYDGTAVRVRQSQATTPGRVVQMAFGNAHDHIEHKLRCEQATIRSS